MILKLGVRAELKTNASHKWTGSSARETDLLLKAYKLIKPLNELFMENLQGSIRLT